MSHIPNNPHRGRTDTHAHTVQTKPHRGNQQENEQTQNENKLMHKHRDSDLHPELTESF